MLINDVLPAPEAPKQPGDAGPRWLNEGLKRELAAELFW